MKPSGDQRAGPGPQQGPRGNLGGLAGRALRWACTAIGRKPRQADRARMPMDPSPADGEPRACARGTISTAVTVAPVVMVTV